MPASTWRAVGLLTLALIALTAPVGAGELPAAAIVAPADGAVVPAGEPLAASGTAGFVEPLPEERTFYLRLVTSCDDLILSVEEGSERGACGHLEAFTPANEVTRRGWTWRATDGVPVTLDATRPIAGVITQYGLANAGAGLGILDVTVAGVADGAPVQLGTTTVTYAAVPLQDSAVPWSITPAPSLDRSDLTALEITVVSRGAQVGMGYTRSNDSRFTLPIWSASFERRVEVSLDDPAFADPVAASLDEDLTSWSAAFPAPAGGGHTLFARARQGWVASEAASIQVTVA